MIKLATVEESKEKKATRAALGATLIELYDEGLPIVAVDADLAGSTTLGKFGAASEETKKRFFNSGIAEQNMIDAAAGLSLAGNIAFTGSFAVFGTGRAYDQIRNTVSYSRLNVKITPTHAGISVGPDGGSHQMIEDIALMRVIPNMRVLVPADYNSAVQAIRIAANTDGPVYVRLGRAAVPTVYSADSQFEMGKAYVVREGSDVTIVACGVEIREALIAADKLADKGISAEVIDAFSIDPLDVDTIVASAKKTGCVVTAEEHSVSGGLGEAVAAALSMNCPVPMRMVGMKGVFGKSGEFEELLEYFALDANAITVSAQEVYDFKQK